MKLIAQNLGKRFASEWIFSAFDYEFEQNKQYAITGPNGSGKSTLLQVLSGITPPSKGKIYTDPSSSLPLSLALATPYQELIEEFTLKEIVELHVKLKPFSKKLSYKEFIKFSQLEKAKNKPIRFFSSGMKQRVKLALAFLTQADLLFLDEPTVNLDQAGIDWYQEKRNEFSQNKIVFICSNQSYEYENCDAIIQISDYKS